MPSLPTDTDLGLCEPVRLANFISQHGPPPADVLECWRKQVENLPAGHSLPPTDDSALTIQSDGTLAWDETKDDRDRDSFSAHQWMEDVFGESSSGIHPITDHDRTSDNAVRPKRAKKNVSLMIAIATTAVIVLVGLGLWMYPWAGGDSVAGDLAGGNAVGGNSTAGGSANSLNPERRLARGKGNLSSTEGNLSNAEGNLSSTEGNLSNAERSGDKASESDLDSTIQSESLEMIPNDDVATDLSPKVDLAMPSIEIPGVAELGNVSELENTSKAASETEQAVESDDTDAAVNALLLGNDDASVLNPPSDIAVMNVGGDDGADGSEQKVMSLSEVFGEAVEDVEKSDDEASDDVDDVSSNMATDSVNPTSATTPATTTVDAKSIAPLRINFSSLHQKQRWDVGEIIPRRQARLQFEWVAPESLDAQWFEPVQADDFAGEHAILVVSPSGEADTVSLAIRVDFSLTRKLSAHVRCAVRLDPSVTWQLIDNRSLQQISANWTNYATAVAAETERLDRMDDVAYEIGGARGKRIIDQKQDAIEAEAKRVAEILRRISVLDVLLSDVREASRFDVGLSKVDENDDLVSVLVPQPAE